GAYPRARTSAPTARANWPATRGWWAPRARPATSPWPRPCGTAARPWSPPDVLPVRAGLLGGGLRSGLGLELGLEFLLLLEGILESGDLHRVDASGQPTGQLGPSGVRRVLEGGPGLGRAPHHVVPEGQLVRVELRRLLPLAHRREIAARELHRQHRQDGLGDRDRPEADGARPDRPRRVGVDRARHAPRGRARRRRRPAGGSHGLERGGRAGHLAGRLRRLRHGAAAGVPQPLRAAEGRPPDDDLLGDDPHRVAEAPGLTTVL